MAKSVWPYDTWTDPITPGRKLNRLSCFLVCPFHPSERWDDLFGLVQAVCEKVGEELQVTFDCVRADHITSAGVIHPEIWEQIRTADVVVVDVSGRNGNVMLELGVAAAWRGKERVIILREADPEEPHLFDINPARHLEYRRTSSGFLRLQDQLLRTVFQALAAAPFEAIPETAVRLPFRAALCDGHDSAYLYAPDIGHRRLLPDCLEFGSLYLFPYSWLSLGNARLRNVQVQAEMRFTLRRDQPCWVGIMLRSQHYYANFGHLVLVNAEGTVSRTVPEDELGGYRNEEVGHIEGFDPEEFVLFDVRMGDHSMDVRVGSVQRSYSIQAMPYVFGAGHVLFQSASARAGIRNVTVQEWGSRVEPSTGSGRRQCRPFGDPAQARVFVIGHDPRLQRSNAEAETVFFLDYLDGPKPSLRSEARKYELAEATAGYLRELTGGQVPLENMYFTNLCNEFLPRPEKGGTVLIPDTVADGGISEIEEALAQGEPQVIIPMSLQVFYHLARSGFVVMKDEQREAFLSKAAPKPTDAERGAYVQSKPRAFMDVCGERFLHGSTPVVPVLHVKTWPLKGPLKAYESAMQTAATNIQGCLSA